tara:strand:- start:33444 stop:34055 length:612 start_codon:yes stop_codon:yes gene_type:complete
MALDTQSIYKGIRSAIQDIDNPVEADRELTGVIKARSRNTRLRFPFATMDIISIQTNGSYLTNKTVSERDDQGRINYQTVKDVVIQISVRGSNKDSYRISEKLQFGFEFDDIRSDLKTVTEGVIADVSDITVTPDVLNTSQQEINSFNVTLRVIDNNERLVDLVESSDITPNLLPPVQQRSLIWENGIWNSDGYWYNDTIWGA